ncbi:fatty acyl-AMP ligase [Allokutzneria oryzae]|uniref:Fatty acyl-AMP ligase n=1 Tax=Allokutzneria oryzae TaxID=1378989 RepID=A0ABV6A4H7_9PSEU
MSQFIDALVSRARATDRGLTTGVPASPQRRTWGEVHEESARVAAALVTAGVRKGDSLAVLAADPAPIAVAVQASWLAGGSVTMLHQPTPRTDLAVWAEDTIKVLAMIGARRVLLGAPFDALADTLRHHGIEFLLIEELRAHPEPLASPVATGEDDVALLQLTSGSTSDPKAVRISHGGLWANIQAMVTAAKLDADSDVLVSWLPLFHDMGMVGFFTVPMVLGAELVKASPAEFVARPLMWLELISRHRGTVTAAPNFGYAVAGRRLSTLDDGAIDLSTLRFALNGAEPIDPASVRGFTDAGARFGLRPECMVSAYGMAEATLGVSFAPLDTGLKVDRIDAEALADKHIAVPVEGGVKAREFPLLGPPLPGLEVQAVGEDGRVLADREVGELRIRGNAVTDGYLTTGGPLATKDSEGWLNTGDEGYLVDGQVVVCGRRKDVIIMGGRNIYPTDVERAAGSVDGVRAGNAVAVRLDAGDRRERFAVAVESKHAGDAAAESAMSKEIAARVMDAVGVRPAAVVVLPPATLPKTPSGKLRRTEARKFIPS